MKKALCTIGFSKKSLRQFVSYLKEAGVTRLVDTRLNNTSQLSGYSKKDDLEYIMQIVGISYTHDISLAPTVEMLNDYRKKMISWEEYEKKYIHLLNERRVEVNMDEWMGDGIPCFLCSEHEPHRCHRRILVEYLRSFNQEIMINHLY